MKLDAKVTALRTNGRMELTITTSATGLEQVITMDNTDGYAMDEEVVVLTLRPHQTPALFDVLNYLDNEKGLLPASLMSLRDQLRPDNPPRLPPQEPAPQSDTATTQEFAREVEQ